MRHPAVTVGAIALGIRLLYCVIAVFLFDKGMPGGSAHDGYLEIAKSVVAGEGYRLLDDPNFFRPPTYVMFLVPWVILPGTQFWILLTQSLLGAATCGMVTLAAMRSVSPRCAIVSGLALAICPWHVHFTTNAMTPVLSGFLMMVFLLNWLIDRDERSGARAIVCGAVFGALAMCHPASVLIGPIWMMDRAWTIRRHKNAVGALMAVVLFAVGGGIVLSPWVIRNWRESGEWIPLTNAAGFQYFVADSMVFGSPSLLSLPPGGAGSGMDQVETILREAGFPPSRTLRPFKGVGIAEGKYCNDWMKRDLLDHPRKLIHRLIKQGWWFWFADRPSMVIFHLLYKTPLLVFALIGVWKGLRHRADVIPILSCVLSFWVVHATIMGHIPLAAYCLTVLGPLCILAGIGLNSLFKKSPSVARV